MCCDGNQGKISSNNSTHDLEMTRDTFYDYKESLQKRSFLDVRKNELNLRRRSSQFTFSLGLVSKDWQNIVCLVKSVVIIQLRERDIIIYTKC